MLRSKDIVYENGPYWVLKDKRGFHAMVSGLTYSVGDSSYADESLAKARVDYFAKTHTPGRNWRLAGAIQSYNLRVMTDENLTS